MNLLLVGITTRPRYYMLSSSSHATRLGAGLPPGATTSVERETLCRPLYGGDMPALEVGGVTPPRPIQTAHLPGTAVFLYSSWSRSGPSKRGRTASTSSFSNTCPILPSARARSTAPSQRARGGLFPHGGRSMPS